MPEAGEKKTRSSAEYPTLLPPRLASSATLLWTVAFFVLINVIVAVTYKEVTDFKRFNYHTSYEEIWHRLELMKKDPRKKIVFIGGSVMWGSDTPNPDEAIPGAFQKLVPKDTAVYNFGLIAVRPLDEYILAWLIGKNADLIIMDQNYLFGFPIAHDNIIREHDSYIRIQQLLFLQGPAFFKAMPETAECLEKEGVAVPKSKAALETRVRAFVVRALPLFRYKDRVNDTIFGLHPTLFLERILHHSGAVYRGKETFLSLFRRDEEAPDPRVWTPTHSEAEKERQKQYLTEVFSKNNMAICMSMAFGKHRNEVPVPMAVYLTPNNPNYFPGLHTLEVHANNIALLTTAVGTGGLFNMDDGSMGGQYFTDTTHLTPEGNAVLAKKLYDTLLKDPRYSSLLR